MTDKTDGLEVVAKEALIVLNMPMGIWQAEARNKAIAAIDALGVNV